MIAARAPQKAAATPGAGHIETLPTPEAAPTHLVAMHPGKNKSATPFFLCAGMFGNVLNLRHLALHIGTDRPVYALQARGLYGEQDPHENFEEMAKDYLAEIRAVQPHGPYLLGGFSGGGLTAYEMARQLTADGEEVAQVILLDTPQPMQPGLSKIDLAQMKLQDIRREGFSFFANWVRGKIEWEEEKRRKRNAEHETAPAEQFHNLRIEAAFRNALPRYKVKPYDGAVALFRPKPEVLYRLSGGRRLQPGRNIILDDNGWLPFVRNLDVQEVPGDHDSMVLEPFVRVLAEHVRSRLRTAIERSEIPLRSAAE
jgi:thioesterase domain-containing protein